MRRAFACPVSGATGREAHTPVGKMTAAHQHLTGARGLDDDSAQALYACTSCGSCTAHCQHESPVGPALFEARVEAVEEGEAPKAVEELRDELWCPRP